MSFRVYAGRVRDRGLPFGRRHRALRNAVGCYCPLGFNGTWAYLSAAGDLGKDEAALLHALDRLEASRTVWIGEMEAFAERRGAEKARHRRTPRRAETRHLLGWRWPGPEGRQAVLGEVGRLRAVHHRSPFPDVPAEDKDALAELDTWLAGCASAYLANGADLDAGRRDAIADRLPQLRRHVARLGRPWDFPQAYEHFRLLLKTAELIHNDTAARDTRG
ncbi:hypothetical protein J5Y04_15700 [Kitasatospora sp. RG8]|uniref:hypothetical protein n=1 Tax=Kitasatospora sp. RG8 TaxID=2820815 RepID=UPI001ADF94C8|nr:hypothetical protein [Kitasatospora sp. RG8]MBP0450977.1 hypothetical protein [Kitasatospora sp. RG8]